MHLLDQGGIPRETLGIQIAHLIDQGLQLLLRLRTILHCGANLVEKIQSLVNLALGIGRVGASLGRHGLTGDASIAGVITAHRVAIAIGRATGSIAYRTGEAVADRTRTRLASAGLPTLPTLLAALLARLAALLALLSGLAVLRLPPAGLPVAVELAGLERLAAGLTSAETG
jgi:hypothetical protein